MLIKMSEARYNDLVYLTLKQFFFEPAKLGGPRQCDIRVCMQMGHLPLLEKAGPAAMILSPTEQAPASHTDLLEIDTDRVFDETLTYVEDHWMKSTFEEAYANPNIKAEMKKFYDESLIPAIMATAEDQCAIELPTP